MVATSDEDALTVIVGTEQFEITELCGSREKFLEVKSCFDGRHSIEEISAKTGVAHGEIAAIINEFAALGIMREENMEESVFIPVSSFLSKVDASCLMWQRQIGFHRLFDLLEYQKVRREVFIGYLLESYHYVNSASKHIAVAIAHCKDEKWRKLLVEYFNDECEHGSLYLDSLEKMGLNRESIITCIS